MLQQTLVAILLSRHSLAHQRLARVTFVILGATMPTGADNYFVQEAVRDLCAAGLSVETKGYGFHLLHKDSAGAYEGECGIEHDWSISLALRVDGAPVRWYFRFSVREMAEFIVSAFVKARAGQFESLAAALDDADRKYDHEELSQRLEALRTSRCT